MAGWRLSSTTCSTTLSNNRPGFDRGDRLTNRCILFHINGSVDGAVPDRGLIAPVDHVYLHLNCSREDRVPAVLGYRLEPVALPLNIGGVLELVVNTERSM